MLYYIRNLIILTLMKNDIHCSGKCSCRFSWFPIIPRASHNMIFRWPWFSRSHAVCMLTAHAGLISLNRRFSTDYFMSELSLTLDPGCEGLMESSLLISSEALEVSATYQNVPKVTSAPRWRTSHCQILLHPLTNLCYLTPLTEDSRYCSELAFPSHGVMLMFVFFE